MSRMATPTGRERVDLDTLGRDIRETRRRVEAWAADLQREMADTSGTHRRGEHEPTREDDCGSVPRSGRLLGASPIPIPRPEPYPFRYEHSRLRLATPITLAVPVMTELVTAASRRKRIARWVLGVAVAVLVAVIVYN